MSADELAWATVTPKKCRHTRDKHLRFPVFDGETKQQTGFMCPTCRKFVPVEATRRGLNNRRRGNAIERQVAKELGLRRVGHFGGPEDAGTAADPFIVQVKSGKSFPERLYRWLKALPSNANQTPLVVVTDAPGPGHRRRALVVLTLEDWVALHGEIGERVA